MKDEVDEDEPGTSSATNSTELLTQYGSSRATRNLAEKQRRDNLNNNIALMASLVPVVAGSSRRQDKISILRLAAAFLRTQYTVGSSNQEFLPSEYNDIDLEQNFLDSFDGSGSFLMVVTSSGNVIHVSRSIEGPLGHAPNELMGKSLYTFVHTDDHAELTKNLTPDEILPAITDVTNHDQNSNSSDDSNQSQNYHQFHEKRRNFNIKLAQRTNSRGEHTQYKCFNISGVLRLANFCRNQQQSRNRNSTSNDVIFVGIARLLQRRFTKLSLFEASKEEYVTRHLVDGRIVFCDHRISVVAGYMSEEVSGSSAFRYMHKDDVRWTIIALRQMYDCRAEFGASCYRLLSKTGEFIYLRTHGFLELDKQTGTFESFVCVNTLVDEEEGEKLIREMKERYSATITNSGRAMIETDPSTNIQSKSQGTVEDPSQLEGVILQLINGLSSPSVTEERLSPSPVPDMQYAKAAMYSSKMPPVSIQAKQYGSPSFCHMNGKEKRMKLERSVDSPTSSNHSVGSPYQETAEIIHQTHNHSISSPLSSSSSSTSSRQNSSVHRINGEILHEHDEEELIMTSPLSTIEERERKSMIHQQPSVSRGKEDYEKQSDSSCENEIEENMLSLPIAHRGKPDSMVMYIKSETIDENKCKKRPLENDDNLDAEDLPNKRRKHEFYGNVDELDKSSFQDIMKSNPEILKMLDEIGQSGEGPELCQQFATEQVDVTLKNLEDRISYQETQLGELELVIESADLQAQRDNFDQLQAEHEIQKKMIKTLQQDHHSMQVKVKQNIGV